MGTNYYAVETVCECCGRYDKEYHIGKSSHGWAFSFRGYRHDRLISWRNWKEFLKNKIIMNEYGERIEYDEFVKMIETYKSPGYMREDGHINLQHNEQGRIDNHPWFNSDYDWDDEDGYSFCTREFS